ncbi:MAG: galactokinase [Desulfobacterales bacterium]|nr:MAG: galactokinase [Desulfobacterales bacterium]
MAHNLRRIIESKPIVVSAPCRLDFGGTLDIPAFYYSLRHLSPCTVNLALGLRTRVELRPFRQGWVKISSTGFETTQYPLHRAPFDHPLGLMFVIAAYFQVDGIHIRIDSQSPPRSALGGSSAAAVALVAALARAFERAGEGDRMSKRQMARLALSLEESVAGVPCGFQDQLAAVYGGVHAWYWQGGGPERAFRKKVLIRKSFYGQLERHLVAAYGGIPHESKNVNAQWVRQYLAGKTRALWVEIVACTQQFVLALMAHDFQKAARIMNRETAIRREMTPDVLDRIGIQLVAAAESHGCGARFTGAGGGGCLWALGPRANVGALRKTWETILSQRREGRLLEAEIDSQGLSVEG